MAETQILDIVKHAEGIVRSLQKEGLKKKQQEASRLDSAAQAVPIIAKQEASDSRSLPDATTIASPVRAVPIIPDASVVSIQKSDDRKNSHMMQRPSVIGARENGVKTSYKPDSSKESRSYTYTF